ncbi:MAG: hypothetical protein HRU38_05420 [Saccharospirillaceae bacterium]|nr:hypothetical protein [Pseudomonadales bacterium]NRB78096.1 hypothetical protein [Saccharospirillaceae bacterium]
MKFLVLLLISFPALAEYEFEKSKYQVNTICDAMVGTWYTDVSVLSEDNVNIRHMTKIDRNVDGSAKLKGLSFYSDTTEVTPWQFSTKWSCDGLWYTEKNEWGYTAFKIMELGQENILKDELDNLSANKIEITEKSNLDFINKNIERYFSSE